MAANIAKYCKILCTVPSHYCRTCNYNSFTILLRLLGITQQQLDILKITLFFNFIYKNHSNQYKTDAYCRQAKFAYLPDVSSHTLLGPLGRVRGMHVGCPLASLAGTFRSPAAAVCGGTHFLRLALKRGMM